MKKVLTMLVVSVFMFVSIAPAFAASNPGEKLSRGVANVFSSVLEIPKQIDVEWKAAAKNKSNVGAGIVAGSLKGLAYMVGRLGSGVWDVISFPFKVPKNYEPVMKPEYVLDK